MPQVKSEILK